MSAAAQTDLIRLCECHVCWNLMRGELSPYYLNCGHIICNLCFWKLAKKRFSCNRIECAECRVVQDFNTVPPTIYQLKSIAEGIYNQVIKQKSCVNCSMDCDFSHYCRNCWESKEDELEKHKKRYIYRRMTPYQRYLYNTEQNKFGIARIVPRDVMIGYGDALPAGAVPMKESIPGSVNNCQVSNANDELVPDSAPSSVEVQSSSASGTQSRAEAFFAELEGRDGLRVNSSPELTMSSLAGPSSSNAGPSTSGEAVFVRAVGPNLAPLAGIPIYEISDDEDNE